MPFKKKLQLSCQNIIYGAKRTAKPTLFLFGSTFYFGDLSIVHTTHGNIWAYHWQILQSTGLRLFLNSNSPSLLKRIKTSQKYVKYLAMFISLHFKFLLPWHLKSTCSWKPSPLTSPLYFLFYTFHLSILWKQH